MSARNFTIRKFCRRGLMSAGFALFGVALLFVWGGPRTAHLENRIWSTQDTPSIFRLGEKLSYNVSFGKFANAAYAETFVASRGKLSGRDAVELRGRVKTLEMVSAAFFMVDETRSVYAAPDTGLP